MGWFTGFVVYTLIWWTVLFAVLPIGVRAVPEADERTGWRGAPARPLLGRKMIATTLIAAVLWCGAAWLINSDYVSFRNGMFAIEGD
jgi:predicted secreted protein